MFIFRYIKNNKCIVFFVFYKVYEIHDRNFNFICGTLQGQPQRDKLSGTPKLPCIEKPGTENPGTETTAYRDLRTETSGSLFHRTYFSPP